MADVVGDLVYEAAIDSGKFDAGLAKLENNAKKAANNVDKAAQKVATLRQQLEELQAVAENEKKTRSTGTVSQETGDSGRSKQSCTCLWRNRYCTEIYRPRRRMPYL